MTTTRLEITGMTCGHCVQAVTRALTATDGVESASVDLKSGSAEVRHDEARVPAGALVAAVEEEGYRAAIA